MKFYTIQEAAKKLGVPEQKIYYEIYVGRIKPEIIANRKVLMDDDIKKLRGQIARSKHLLTPKEYCRRHKMSRSKFDYRKSTGKIKTIKIAGKVFVQGGKR